MPLIHERVFTPHHSTDLLYGNAVSLIEWKHLPLQYYDISNLSHDAAVHINSIRAKLRSKTFLHWPHMRGGTTQICVSVCVCVDMKAPQCFRRQVKMRNLSINETNNELSDKNLGWVEKVDLYDSLTLSRHRKCLSIWQNIQSVSEPWQKNK